jgi:hypothetical protein
MRCNRRPAGNNFPGVVVVSDRDHKEEWRS